MSPFFAHLPQSAENAEDAQRRILKLSQYLKNYHCHELADLHTMGQASIRLSPNALDLTFSDSFPVPTPGSEVVRQMPEMIRSIVGRLREFAGDRRHAYRRRLKLPFTVSIHHLTGQANGRRPVPAMEGYTRDISSTGLGLIVPAIRIGEHYLTGEDRLLRVVLELPSGSIQLIVTPVRYEPIGEDENEQGFVIGARITDISAQDLERFTSALKSRQK